jgi:malonyl-CoA O-methyltransferase
MSEQVQVSHTPGLWAKMKRHFAFHGLRRSTSQVRREVSCLSAGDAYRLWAPTYATETVISSLDEQLAQKMLIGLPDTCLLDAGCGIGRRIAKIAGAIGIDASPEMLAAGGAHNVITGDIRSMPFSSNRFDMIWCRLVLGHIQNPLPAYLELSRVCLPGGYVFVTDFHSDAVAAGHRRSFTDQTGRVHDIEHYVHHDHVDLASQAGLDLVSHRDGAIGPSVREHYQQGLGVKAYKHDLNLRIVAAFLYRRSK